MVQQNVPMDAVDLELEELYGLLQDRGAEVSQIEKLIVSNESDPAYVLGEFAEALLGLAGDVEHGEGDPRFIAMAEDALRLKKSWFYRYPEFQQKMEQRAERR